MSEVPFVVILSDGYRVEGMSAWEVCDALRRMDWGARQSVLDFKRGAARRCEVAGMHLLFWDESSFLYAAHEAKVFRLVVHGVEP